MKVLVVSKPIYNYYLPLVDFPSNGDVFNLDSAMESIYGEANVAAYIMANYGMDVSYTGIDLDSDYCVKFIAHANNVDLEDIYATVIVASYPTVRPQGWNCVLSEAGSGDPVSDYDGFNYSISGTGAKNLKFSYDASKLAVNPACYQLDSNNDIAAPTAYSGSGTGSKYSTWKTIVISADPEQTFVNQYDLQLYKIGSYSPTTYDAIDQNKTNAFVEFE